MTQMADVFDLPEDHILRVAHRASIYHRQAIEQSRQCGCFYCLKLFGPEKVCAWTDRHRPHAEHTALCPYCGVDSVIGDASGLEITEAFLDDMNRHWFDAGSPTDKEDR